LTGKRIDQFCKKEHLENALDLNLHWIKNSFAHNQNKGSSGSSNIFGRFSSPYPETTGYLLPTLLLASNYLNNPSLKDLALDQIDFFYSIRNEDGSFYQSLENKKPIVFDTGQILLGLSAVYQKHPSHRILELISGSQSWLLSNLNEKGAFTKYNYHPGYNPSYYSRVFWAMFGANKILKHKNQANLLEGYNNLLSLKNNNLSFKNWHFTSQSEAFTHTIIYTLRGLWESAVLLNDFSTQEYVKLALSDIITRFKKEGNTFYGAYDHNWKANKSFQCSTGNAQLAILLLKVFRKEVDLDIIYSLIVTLLSNQKKSGQNKGAVSSSIPLWGKYQRFSQTGDKADDAHIKYW